MDFHHCLKFPYLCWASAFPEATCENRTLKISLSCLPQWENWDTKDSEWKTRPRETARPQGRGQHRRRDGQTLKTCFPISLWGKAYWSSEHESSEFTALSWHLNRMSGLSPKKRNHQGCTLRHGSPFQGQPNPECLFHPKSIILLAASRTFSLQSQCCCGIFRSRNIYHNDISWLPEIETSRNSHLNNITYIPCHFLKWSSERER